MNLLELELGLDGTDGFQVHTLFMMLGCLISFVATMYCHVLILGIW